MIDRKTGERVAMLFCFERMHDPSHGAWTRVLPGIALHPGSGAIWRSGQSLYRPDRTARRYMVKRRNSAALNEWVGGRVRDGVADQVATHMRRQLKH
jgi:hypothetical protein